jgi:hypothetical protein
VARGPYCEHGRGCEETDLTAQFTMKLSEVTKENIKTIPQPQFYCRKHRNKHPDVSPVTGQPLVRR